MTGDQLGFGIAIDDGLLAHQRPRVHAASTDTERAAAALVAPRAGTWRRKVLDAIRRSADHGLTDYELHIVTDGRQYTIAPRRKELVDAGFVIDSGRRRETDSGASAIVWILSPIAREANF